MLMMRLQRIGRKNSPTYRVIITDKRESTKSNRFAEIVGTYEPKSGTIELKADRITHWLKMGVKASPTVHNMLVSKKIIEGKKINVLPKMKNRKVAEPVAEVVAEPALEKVKEAPVATEEVAEVVAEAPADEVAPEAPTEIAEETPTEIAEETPTEVATETKEAEATA